MKVLVFDPFDGVSGDMIVGALVSAGAPVDFVLENLYKAKIKAEFLRVTRKSIDAVFFKPLEGPSFSNYTEIQKFLKSVKIEPPVAELVSAMFKNLALAEAEVHGVDLEDVHFHQLGEFDTLADIIATAAGVISLGIEKCFCLPINVGLGMINFFHGSISSPAPATAWLLKGFAVFSRGKGELSTPTGAAIVKTLCSPLRDLPDFVLSQVGYGAASSESLLRVMVGTMDGDFLPVVEVKTNVDNLSGEDMGYIAEQIRSFALDVCFIPIYMKKGRPAYQLQVLITPEHLNQVFEILSGFPVGGMRFVKVSRLTSRKQFLDFKYKGKRVRIKKFTFPSGEVLFPEYEDCVKIANRFNRSIWQVRLDLYKELKQFYNQSLGGDGL